MTTNAPDSGAESSASGSRDASSASDSRNASNAADSRIVRAERTDAGFGRGGWNPNLEARTEAVDRAVRSLLEPSLARLREAAEIVVVPDAHYPFHPSSGTVTDPAVVASLCSGLRRETAATLSVAGTSDERAGFERTATYLNYPAAIERSGASLLDLATAEDVRVRVSLHGDGERSSDELPDDDGRAPRDSGRSPGDGGPKPNDATVTVPEPLLEAAIVVVPTLRPTRRGSVAGAMRTLGRHAQPADGAIPDGRLAYATTRAVDPALALLDATTVFAGEPFAGDALLAGEPAAVDAVGADLLDRSAGDDEALSIALGGGTTSIRVDGADLAALKAALPGGDLPPTNDVHPAVSAAYGLYARVAGDAVPPQLEVDR